jgi:hypothetical protein
MAKTRAQEGACTMAEPEDTGPNRQGQDGRLISGPKNEARAEKNGDLGRERRP